MRALRVLVLMTFVIVTAMFIVFYVGEKRTTDNTIPVITVDSELIEVSFEATDEELLKGVTAYDEKDKDITDKIALVENRQNDPADIEQAKREALPDGEFQVGDLKYKASENSSGVTVCGLSNEDATKIQIPSQIKYITYFASLPFADFLGDAPKLAKQASNSTTEKIVFFIIYHFYFSNHENLYNHIQLYRPKLQINLKNP